MKNSLARCALAGLITTSVALAGCQTDEPPELPRATTMSVDIEAMAAAPAVAKDAPSSAAPSEYNNFANAWLRVKVLQLYAAGVVVVPALAIGAALLQDPSFDGDRWIWTITVAGVTGELEVSHSLIEGFDVELYVTGGELDRFLWVEGNFGDGTGTGEWVLHDPDITGGDDSALAIRWTYAADDDRSLTYEVLSSASPDVGDSITYAVSGNTASVVYTDASDAGLVAEIEWDRTTGVGSLEVPGYNNGERACWDASFVNAACP